MYYYQRTRIFDRWYGNLTCRCWCAHHSISYHPCDKIEVDIVILPEGEGEEKIYSISSIQFPNIVTQGNTIEQAKTRLKEALELYFEEMPNERKTLVKIEKEDNMPMISRMLL